MTSLNSPEDTFALLRWGIVSEYCTFQESLNLRLVCKSWCSSVGEAMSFTMCTDFLSKYLEEQNMFILARGLERWKDPLEISENVAKLMRGTSTTNSLTNMLRLMHLIQHFPEQVAVAFSPSYGRHCIPMDWDGGKRISVLKHYKPCRRNNCPTCQLPVRNKVPLSKESDIDSHLEFQNSVGPLDLTYYEPKCVPNLPADICCPVCQTTSERTLVLSESSYRSTSSKTPQDHVPLTWAPSQDQGHFKSTNDPSGQDTSGHDQRPPSKRHKSDRSDRLFPPQFDDMAIPTRDQPLSAKPDSRHAISVHCSKCYSFALVAPAAPCWNIEYCCYERGRHIEDGTILGGVFSRATCCMEGCVMPVTCHYCSHSNFHDSYIGENGESQRLLRRSPACDSCCKTYCAEHSWIATACHHW